MVEGFPGGSGGTNLPLPVQETGVDPDLGRPPQAEGQLSPCMTTTEPAL